MQSLCLGIHVPIPLRFYRVLRYGSASRPEGRDSGVGKVGPPRKRLLVLWAGSLLGQVKAEAKRNQSKKSYEAKRLVKPLVACGFPAPCTKLATTNDDVKTTSDILQGTYSAKHMRLFPSDVPAFAEALPTEARNLWQWRELTRGAERMGLVSHHRCRI